MQPVVPVCENSPGRAQKSRFGLRRPHHRPVWKTLVLFHAPLSHGAPQQCRILSPAYAFSFRAQAGSGAHGKQVANWKRGTDKNRAAPRWRQATGRKNASRCWLPGTFARHSVFWCWAPERLRCRLLSPESSPTASSYTSIRSGPVLPRVGRTCWQREWRISSSSRTISRRQTFCPARCRRSLSTNPPSSMTRMRRHEFCQHASQRISWLIRVTGRTGA